MRPNEEENTRNREFSAKISELHLNQKNSFRKLFESGIEFNWKDPKIIKLICQGIPSVYRSRVWPRILENYHGINAKYYESLLKKAEHLISTNPNEAIPERVRTIAHLNKIELDIERTYPDLKIFLKESEQGQYLFNLLSAWIIHREDVGYIQGMSQIAGLLLLELKEIEAFALFCSVITTDVVFMYENMDITDIELFETRFEKRVKKLNEELYIKLKESGVETRSYLLNWVLTLFTRTMSLDMVSQLWDILFIYGISSDILIEVGYYLLLAFRKRLGSSYEAEELIPIMKGLKLNDLEAHCVLCNLREFYRCLKIKSI